jgi:hypothetical protein
MEESCPVRPAALSEKGLAGWIWEDVRGGERM